MSVPVKTAAPSGEVMESVILQGDLAKLTPAERTTYYFKVCDSIGLNPYTQPFEYIILNGKMRLYAKRDCADQLRKINDISIQIVSQERVENLLIVHARATNKDGRTDEDLGAVAFGDNLVGEARANAILKAVTKAKRRVTLSISGLGFLDETEVESIPASAKRPAAPAANIMNDDPYSPGPPPLPEETSRAASRPVPSQQQSTGSPPVVVPTPTKGSAEAGTGSVIDLEAMAREAAMRGTKVFNTFYKNRTADEKLKLNSLGDELRRMMNEADQKP